MPESTVEHKSIARNALSKLTTVFGYVQKPHFLQDYHITLHQKDPNHRYSPGDVVRGQIHVKPKAKSIRITHITVELYGYVQVFKNFHAPGNGLSREASHTDPIRVFSCPGIVNLFSHPVERVPCGEGKIPPRGWIVEFALPLPAYRLPTSIDFERGTITYMIGATITRPTTIVPVVRCDPRKIYVNERIDVAKIPPAKAREVTLEPVEPRVRTKYGTKKSLSLAGLDGPTFQTDRPPSPDRSSTSYSTGESHASFSLSDNTSVSNCSDGIDMRLAGHDGVAVRNPAGSRISHSSTTAAMKRAIHAKAEVLRSAVLPGDSIPIKITVAHTKPIKSMCGVIVTLYRKTHIETQPIRQRCVIDANGNEVVETSVSDIFPSSITGLGGLSLSSTGTSNTYRMDIAQVTVPLYVDPQTLQAEISTSLHVPTEAMSPTITNVKGGTIDIRYYVEVCLDLQGKLDGPRYLPRMTAQPLFSFVKPSKGSKSNVPLSIAAQGTHMIDTQLIRRDKPQVLAWQFHVIVGTVDTGRSKFSKAGKRPLNHKYAEINAPSQRIGSLQDGHYSDIDIDDFVSEQDQQTSTGRDAIQNGMQGNEREQPCIHDLQSPPPPAFPLPQLEEPTDEKGRNRQAEERLLPSAPPMDEVGALHPVLVLPSAPPLQELEALEDGCLESHRDSGYGSSGSGSGVATRTCRQAKGKTRQHKLTPDRQQGNEAYICCHTCGIPSRSRAVTLAEDQMIAGPPSASHQIMSGFVEQSTSSMADSTRTAAESSGVQGGSSAEDIPKDSAEDKQELERRRLQTQASAPESPSSFALLIHVPNITDVHDGNSNHAVFGDYQTRSDDDLPRYER